MIIKSLDAVWQKPGKQEYSKLILRHLKKTYSSYIVVQISLIFRWRLKFSLHLANWTIILNVSPGI